MQILSHVNVLAKHWRMETEALINIRPLCHFFFFYLWSAFALRLAVKICSVWQRYTQSAERCFSDDENTVREQQNSTTNERRLSGEDTHTHSQREARAFVNTQMHIYDNLLLSNTRAKQREKQKKKQKKKIKKKITEKDAPSVGATTPTRENRKIFIFTWMCIMPFYMI